MVYDQSGKAPFVFMAVLDLHSRFLYTEIVPQGRVNRESIQLVFSRMFKYQNMPKFSILRCDKDRTMLSLKNNFFARHNILLMVKRGKLAFYYLKR